MKKRYCCNKFNGWTNTTVIKPMRNNQKKEKSTLYFEKNRYRKTSNSNRKKERK